MHQSRGARGQFVALSGIYRVRGPADSAYSVLLVDEAGLPVAHLSEWYRLSDLPERTRDTYLDMLRPFTGFQRRGGHVWSAPPLVIQEQVRQFLRADLHCLVPAASKTAFDTYIVRATAATPLTDSSLKVLLAALRHFYEVMREQHLYAYPNPMQSQVLAAWRRERAHVVENAGAPNTAGVRGIPWEQQDLEPRATFHVRAARWEPAMPLQPEEARLELRTSLAFLIRHAPSRRDRLVLLLLAQTGARLSEILGLSAGGLRRGVFLSADGLYKAKVRNKGSGGRETKFIYFTDRVYRELLRYIRHERAASDPHRRTRLEHLGDDDAIFLTQAGRPYTAPAFRYHWRTLIRRVPVQRMKGFTPHDIRHLVVTENMARIRAGTQHDPERRHADTAGFARLMGWRGRRTIEAYDHSFAQADALGIVAQWHTVLEDELTQRQAVGHSEPGPQNTDELETPRTEADDDVDGLDHVNQLERSPRIFNFWEN